MLPEGTDELIDLALREDIGDGDHTTLATIPAGTRGAARLMVKDRGVLAGVEFAEALLARHAPGLSMKLFLQDGAAVVPGDVAFTLMGPARDILTVERTLLNAMQRMSGIATLTRRFTEALAGTGCKVLDTRKTSPGLRAIEKWAVRIGGGHNHRMGLYDMVLIKDNHIDMAGGIVHAVMAVRDYLDNKELDLAIEVEARNMKEVDQVLALATDPGGKRHVQRLLLDNFGTEALRKAVDRIAKRVTTEASGGITLENARAFAGTGVDFISVGALTHSAPSLDLSLKAL